MWGRVYNNEGSSDERRHRTRSRNTPVVQGATCMARFHTGSGWRGRGPHGLFLWPFLIYRLQSPSMNTGLRNLRSWLGLAQSQPKLSRISLPVRSTVALCAVPFLGHAVCGGCVLNCIRPPVHVWRAALCSSISAHRSFGVGNVSRLLVPTRGAQF